MLRSTIRFVNSSSSSSAAARSLEESMRLIPSSSSSFWRQQWSSKLDRPIYRNVMTNEISLVLPTQSTTGFDFFFNNNSKTAAASTSSSNQQTSVVLDNIHFTNFSPLLGNEILEQQTKKVVLEEKTAMQKVKELGLVGFIVLTAIESVIFVLIFIFLVVTEIDFGVVLKKVGIDVGEKLKLVVVNNEEEDKTEDKTVDDENKKTTTTKHQEEGSSSSSTSSSSRPSWWKIIVVSSFLCDATLPLQGALTLWLTPKFAPFVRSGVAKLGWKI